MLLRQSCCAVSHVGNICPMGGVSCQVAAEPDLAPLLSELVDNSDGQEIYLRRPERYGLDSSSATTFAHVSLL